MRVIGTVGLPGSGKGVFTQVAKEMGIPVVKMGDVVRQACHDRGLDPNEHHGQIARQLREEVGPGVIAERSLPLIENALEESNKVLIDGIRSKVEVEAFEAEFGDAFMLVGIEAPFELRDERINMRERDMVDRESLRERDERERGFGIDDAINSADINIENTDTLEEFRNRVREVLNDDDEDQT